MRNEVLMCTWQLKMSILFQFACFIGCSCSSVQPSCLLTIILVSYPCALSWDSSGSVSTTVATTPLKLLTESTIRNSWVVHQLYGMYSPFLVSLSHNLAVYHYFVFIMLVIVIFSLEFAILPWAHWINVSRITYTEIHVVLDVGFLNVLYCVQY